MSDIVEKVVEEVEGIAFIGGFIQKYTLVNGIREGYYELSYKLTELKIVQSYYKNGKKDGVYIDYYYNGQKRIETTFKNNMEDGLYEAWYGNGKKYISGYYVNNKKEGLWEAWYSDGKLLEQYNCKDGLKDGAYTKWNKDGSYTIIHYKNDIKTGWAQKFTKDNHIIEERYYEYSRIVNLKEIAHTQCKSIKEELIAKVYHPDRLESICKLYNMEAMDYMDILE